MIDFEDYGQCNPELVGGLGLAICGWLDRATPKVYPYRIRTCMNPSSSEAQPAQNEDYKDGRDKNNRGQYKITNLQGVTPSQSSLIMSRVFEHEWEDHIGQETAPLTAGCSSKMIMILDNEKEVAVQWGEQMEDQ